MTVLAYVSASDGAAGNTALDTADKVAYTVTFMVTSKAVTDTVKIELKKAGSPTGTVKAALSSDYKPLTSYLVESDSLDVADLTTDYTEQTLTWASPLTLYPYICYTLKVYIASGTFTAPDLVYLNSANSDPVYHALSLSSASAWANNSGRVIFSLEGTAASDTEEALSYLAPFNTDREYVLATSQIAINRDHPTADDTPNRSAVYQTFVSPAYETKLSKACFMLNNETLSGNGPLKMKVYAVSGAGDTDAVPTGTALAESDAATPAPNGIYSSYIFSFTEANQITLDASTEYALTLEGQSGFDDTHGLSVMGLSSGTYTGGNWGRYFNSAWGYSAAYDGFFCVYGYPFQLTIESVSNGSTYPAAGSTNYSEGAEVVVYAQPDRSYILSSWQIDSVTQSPKETRFTVSMSESKILTPVFAARYGVSNLKVYSGVKDLLRRNLGVSDFNVTLHKLSLGAQDADTGLPAKTYTDETVELLIVSKDSTALRTALGVNISFDAVGFTTSYVRAYDKVTAATGLKYTVSNVHPVLDGQSLVYYKVDLQENKI